MSEDTPASVDEPQLDSILGPPPADFDGAAAPTKVMENILLRFLARVIHADGEVHAKELSMLLELAINLEVPGDEARRILDDEFDSKSDVAELARQLPDETRRRESYAMGCLMGASDGTVADAERGVLADFARGAEIPEEDAQGILDAVIAAVKQTLAEQAAASSE